MSSHYCTNLNKLLARLLMMLMLVRLHSCWTIPIKWTFGQAFFVKSLVVIIQMLCNIHCFGAKKPAPSTKPNDFILVICKVIVKKPTKLSRFRTKASGARTGLHFCDARKSWISSISFDAKLQQIFLHEIPSVYINQLLLFSSPDLPRQNPRTANCPKN